MLVVAIYVPVLFEQQGLVDPVLRKDGSTRIMSFEEYVLRRAEIEYKAELGSEQEGTDAKLNARNIYRELRKLRESLDVASNSEVNSNLASTVIDRVKTFLTQTDIDNFVLLSFNLK